MAEPTYELKTDRMVLNFGPQHPATHGTLRLVLELDGEVVVKVEPHIGYLHSGFEKLGEHKTYNQWITLSDRMNYLSPLCNNIGFAQAVEKLIGIDIPERAKYIRVILAEMARIADHMVWLGTHALDIGAFTAFLYAFEARENLYVIFEHTTGTRLTTSYTRVGGLFRDVPPDFPEMTRNFLKYFPKVLKELHGLLTRNRIWVDRTKGIGYLSKEDAINLGVTGPVLRGSGVPYDVRKDHPYLIYDRLDFEIPVCDDGDVYSRYLVRMEELEQSLKIIEQCIKDLPDGPVSTFDSKVKLPDKLEVYDTIEGLIHHFKNIMPGHGFEVPVGEIYDATEAPNGELGFYIVSDGSHKAYRLRVRPPSFVNFAAMDHMTRGYMVSDVVAILGSLNIIAGELDR
ncbi:MAG: NADH-quinone oxidoreductase subunit D [Calditrichaeota bacterium]|nr:MAG: NADH-quinone oxidoreductase subunit D [Calditrichota bacterium]